MANVTLGFLRDQWKAVADWVKGTSNDLPKVTLSGSDVSIGGVTYRLLPDGNTLVGTAAQRPSASAAANAIGNGVVYWATDANTYERSDGTAWGDLL